MAQLLKFPFHPWSRTVPEGSDALVCGIVMMSLWQSKLVYLLVTGKQKGRSRGSQGVKNMSLRSSTRP